MPDYKVPLREIRFAMNEVLDFPGHYSTTDGCEEASPDMVDAILDEAAKFVEKELVPLHQVGDQQGCQWQDGVVTTPEGFKQAYQAFIDNGWSGLAKPVAFGGQGMPSSLSSVLLELMVTANHAWAMYPSLSWGAVETLVEHGTEQLVNDYVPSLVAGNWSGTMCLTEAHCGSDLGLLRTKAEPVADGSYQLTGSKIFISSGEHDLSDNIIHIVLARLLDAPAGTRGISLFLVPKFLPDADGNPGQRNGVSCGSIEHKMGINGNATCVMNFDKATGYLIGEANKGLNHMFTFINESRLGVAQQGHAAIERSFQGALAYAKERLQMRAPVRKLPDQAADPIIAHPDVRRMLLTQKALAEGGRLLNYYCAKQVDISHASEGELKQQADSLLALLTPIAKGFLTETGIEAANNGIQVLGGHGYINEWGMEQIARDVRITTIYEGTTGIQGLDLLGRKILASGGKLLEPFVAEIKAFIEQHRELEELQPFTQLLDEKVDQWIALTQHIGAAAMKDADEVNAAAYDYLMYSGYTVVAYFWARSAQVAIAAEDSDYYQAKLLTARFYFDRLLPRTDTLAATIRSGAANLTALEEDAFSFL
jgi:alkylation response protein AidB-like acyl-CoA dehydrogenase